MNNLINIEMIETFRKNNNLTKKDFCKLCRISYSTYQKILKGKNFRLLALFKIARILKIDISQIFSK